MAAVSTMPARGLLQALGCNRAIGRDIEDWSMRERIELLLRCVRHLR